MAAATDAAAIGRHGLIDTRTLGKPPTFAGDDAQWSEWSFQMKAHCACVH